MFLAPVFAVLSACGGSEPSMDASAANASPTANFASSSSAKLSADSTGSAGASRPADYAPDNEGTRISDDAIAAAPTGDFAQAGSPAENGPQLLATVTTSAATSYTLCAKEWATCSFTGTKSIRYGANGSYKFKTATTSIPCNNTSFGDPLPGVAKACDYVADTTTTPPPPSGTRDPMKQPFASNSIWNMPIGSGAQYVAANISGTPGNNIWAGMPGIDDEKIFMTPTAPMTAINASNAAWSGRNRCSATGGLLVSVPMPSGYLVPNNSENSSAAFLMGDKRTVVQTQPLARCYAGGSATSLVKFANVDLYGPGITGAHGGSGLSAIGGSVRVGELRPGTTVGPRHALKVNVYAKEVLYKCTTRSACSRWPATTSDGYAVGWYGTANNNSNTATKMGALLAIPASKDIASLNLETAPAKQLAWTLQNYGAYIVDDTYAPGFALNTEEGPNGSMRTQFKADWGFDLEQKVTQNTPWVRDMQKLAKALSVVNNNSATSIGGGGTPRQPLAAAIAP